MLNVHPMVRSKSPSRFARTNTISECEQREEQLRFIAHELGHRTKNLLAVVQAIANQTAQRSATMKDFQTAFSERLQGLSRSLDLLVEENGRGASIADLVRSQLGPFAEVDGMRIAATGPTVFLNHEATRSIGLALHELATNASKHGALSVPKGVVTVNWEIRPSETGPHFRLIWREHNGPQVMPPKRLGFGHVVLQRTTGKALQGKATHEFGSGGVSWTLEAPAAAVVVPEQTDRPADRRFPKIGSNGHTHIPGKVFLFSKRVCSHRTQFRQVAASVWTQPFRGQHARDG